MKKTKEFFGVLFGILISVFLVIFIVQATTTISTDIQTGGTVAIGGTNHSTEFSVVGTASISEDLWASGSFQFGGGITEATKSYSRLGGEDTSHSLASASDLLISGVLEVDSIVYFDAAASVSAGDLSVEDGNFSVDGGTASISGGLIIGTAGVTITSGTASISSDCVQGSIYLRSGIASMGLAFNVCDNDNSWTSLASESESSSGW